MAGLICPYCKKKYVIAKAFQRHLSLCELRHAKDLGLDAPSSARLYAMLQTVVARQDALAASLEQLRARTPTQKKVGIKEWLEHTRSDAPDLGHWLHALEISDRDLEYVFEHGFIKGIRHMLRRLVPPGGLGDDVPLASYSTHPTVVFAHTNGGGWAPAAAAEFSAIAAHISRGLLKQLIAWQTTNAHRFGAETFDEQMPQRVRRATGADCSQDVINQHIRTVLCGHLRSHARMLIEVAATDDELGHPGDGERCLKGDAAHPRVARPV